MHGCCICVVFFIQNEECRRRVVRAKKDVSIVDSGTKDFHDRHELLRLSRRFGTEELAVAFTD